MLEVCFSAHPNIQYRTFFCSGGLGDGVCGLWSLVCVAVVGMGVLVGGWIVGEVW